MVCAETLVRASPTSTAGWRGSPGFSSCWGAVASRDVVGIINQVDFVEDFFATDARLGQAMITTRAPRVRAARRQLDSCLRIASKARSNRRVGPQRGFDWGLSYFFGTTRQPQLLIVDPTPLAEVFQPLYELLHQGGLEARYVNGGWRVQAESIVRGGQGPTFDACRCKH